MLDQLGRYIVQDGEAGVAVYRQAHQSLADHLRPPYQGTPDQPFDPRAVPVATALLNRYRTLLTGGVAVTAPTYLWRYVWRHAAAAGPEGLERLRTVAALEPALVADVAMAALEIANRLRYWGRWQEAVAPAEEAERLYRELAETNPGFLPDVAMALNNLGNRYGDVGRRQDAVAPAEEAVRLRRELAETNPAFVPDLAGALTSLDRICTEIGVLDRAAAAWQSALTNAQPSNAALLLLARARASDPGQSDAVVWLAEAASLADTGRTLTAAVHEEARRHRSTNRDGFDAAWTQAAGTLPSWLNVDADLLAAAQGWITTATYSEERDYLSAHEELLASAADDAIAEALLAVEERAAERYRMLRVTAQAEGVEAAYRPLLLTILGHQFIGADLAGKRALLAERRDDLTSDIVAAMLEAQESDDTGRVAFDRALLQVAALGKDGPVLDAVEDPARFPDLLHELAKENSGGLAAAAMVAYLKATTHAETAVASFYLAIAAALNDDEDTAREVIAEARQLDRSQSDGWITQLAELGQHQPAVLRLIAVIVAPSTSSPDSDSSDNDSGAEA